MKIALLVEGPSDEKPLSVIIQKSLGEPISVVPRVLRGRGNLLNAKKVYAIINALLKQHPDVSKIIACVDLECTRDSGTEQKERSRIRTVERSVRSSVGEQASCSICYIPVTYATEGWLLADPDAIRQYLRRTITIPPSATLDCDPKQVMKELFGKVDREFVWQRDNPKIAQRVHIDTMLKGNKSFAVFQEKVKDP